MSIGAGLDPWRWTQEGEDKGRTAGHQAINELVAIRDTVSSSGSAIVAPSVVRVVQNRRSVPSSSVATVKAEALGQGALGEDAADVVAGFVRAARRQR